MFNVSNTNISITRGDSATLCVELKDQTRQPYELQEGDELLLTVKVDANQSEHVLQLPADQAGTFTFLPESTAGLSFRTYKYDIQLTTSAGEVYTVIPVSAFTVMEEVTWSAPAGESQVK